jgi:hypothetical protein
MSKEQVTKEENGVLALLFDYSSFSIFLTAYSPTPTAQAKAFAPYRHTVAIFWAPALSHSLNYTANAAPLMRPHS